MLWKYGAMVTITSTVEPLLSGHPRGNGKWPLNRGWPLKRGYSEISTENSEKAWQKRQ